MSTQGIESNAIDRAVSEWRSLAERMDTLSRDMAGYELGGLPASVLGEARTFLDAWSEVAGESADIASGYADALQATLDDFRGEDEGSAERFDDLEGSVR